MSLGLLTRYGMTRAAAGGGGGGDTFGIESTSGLIGAFSSADPAWEFQVGASDITVTKLRCAISTISGSETMRLWRVSDSAELGAVTVTVSPVSGEWVEGTLSSSIVLSAGANYALSMARASSRTWYYTETFTTNSAVTYVQGRFGNSGLFPSTTTGAQYIRGLVDIVFTV